MKGGFHLATKKEIKEILKEISVTEQEMDNYWNELIPLNSLVRQLNNCSKTWRDMNSSVIKTIPNQKQKDLDRIEKEKIEKEQQELLKKKEKEDAKYYEDNFEIIMVNKIENKEKLTEKELKNLVWSHETDREEGENRRWTRTVTSIVKLNGRTFSLDWEEGLTESQENDYYNQPYEVKKQFETKTIEVVSWVATQ